MSFFTNFNSDRCPCRISGNPVSGLTEKVCIEVNKVFDACMRQSQEDGLTVSLTDYVPENPTYPLTFVSARSTATQADITSQQIDRLQDRPDFARVQVTVAIPVEVTYTDANNQEGRASGTVSLSQDVIMYIPQPSVIPYRLSCVASLVSTQGQYVGEDTNTFTLSACVTLILKVIMPVDLLIPSYGYCNIPPCQDYTQEVCAGFFELPLFPEDN